MKNYFKTAICICLAALLAVSAAGCSGGNGNTISKSNADTLKIEEYDFDATYHQLIVENKKIHEISDMLYGVFFEDINFAADGGLYAEMIANRSFEFTELAKDDQMFHWNTVGNAQAEVKINDTANALNENNTNYLVIANNGGEPAGVENIGFMEGMAIKNEGYNFSLYAKGLDSYSGGITVRLVAGEETAAEGRIDEISDKWEKYSLKLESSLDANENVRLQVLTDGGKIAVDMVSLFPENTYKNLENGMRNDLATLLEELTPRFLRFPGGCVIEGYDAATAYDWKASVGADKNGEPLKFNGKYGDVAARKQGVDLWTDINATDDEYPSFMSYGLGFFEYFQLAEDIGAVGVPVINAGLYCQGREGKAVDMKSPEFKKYVNDMLDLVEFCRGDESTKWGKVRCDLGHKEPFELKYICIGNENHSMVYWERYSAFLKALNAAKAENPELYKGIELIYSSGGDDAISGNETHLQSFEYAKSQLKGSKKATDFAGAIDSHYYNEPEWFLEHTDYYDKDNYRRSVSEMTDTLYGGAINVFVGEYASLSNNMKSALSEAAFMTGFERNGDIVRMAAYAPLFSSTTARHWAPNLIWFNNSTTQPSANYYVQKLFSNYAGSTLIKSSLDDEVAGKKDINGMVGVGTWNTAASFDDVRITNNETGEVLEEENFENKKGFKKWEIPSTGSFKVDGRLNQTETETEYSDLGSIAYFGDSAWTNYTYTLKAVKNGGSEGFFIPFAVKDSSNMFFWNIGGWNNTVSCLQQMSDGKKTGQLLGTTKDFVAEEGKEYELKIVVDKTNIKCYIDGELYVDYDAATTRADTYYVSAKDENGNVIVKLVNVSEKEITYAVTLTDFDDFEGTVEFHRICAEDLNDENVLGEEEKISPRDFTHKLDYPSFNYTAPKYSVTVIVFNKKASD